MVGRQRLVGRHWKVEIGRRKRGSCAREKEGGMREKIRDGVIQNH